MPTKRRRKAQEPDSDGFSLASSSSISWASSARAQPTTSSSTQSHSLSIPRTDNRASSPRPGLFKRLFEWVAISPRKRQRLDFNPNVETKFILPSPHSSNPFHLEPITSGFVDISSPAEMSLDPHSSANPTLSPRMLQNVEGAIHYPGPQTSQINPASLGSPSQLHPSISTSDPPDLAPAPSDPEAVQHPVTPCEDQPTRQPEADMSENGLIAPKDPELDDLEQTILLNASSTQSVLESDKQHLGHRQSDDLSRDATSLTPAITAKIATRLVPSNIVDLTHESDEDSNAADNDPDKENDDSILITASPISADTSTLPSSIETLMRSATTDTRARSAHPLLGPLAGSLRKQGQKTVNQSSSYHHLPAWQNHLGSQSSSTSAMQEVTQLGRSLTQIHFPHSRRRSTAASFGSFSAFRDPDQRSLSASSVTSSISTHALSPKQRSSVYRKKSPIYIKKHEAAVEAHFVSAIKRSASRALTNLNGTLQAKRLPRYNIHLHQFQSMAVKSAKVKTLVDAENSNAATSRRPPQDFMQDLVQRFLRQREKDAQSVLPVPHHKSVEMERLKREQRAKLKKLRGVLGRRPLPHQLTQEAEKEVDMVLRKPGKIASIPGAEVDDRDVQKLRPGQWLNDEVINFYGNLILHRANDADKKRLEAIKLADSKSEAAEGASVAASTNQKAKIKIAEKHKPKRPYPQELDAFWRVHFFSSFFWENLKNRGFDGVKRWTRKIDIFSKDLILFPINLGNAHWVCGAINMRRRRFEYYDSMGHRNERAFQMMRDYVVQEARDKKKKELDLRGWRDIFSDETPQQENGYDCGVFATQTLEQISRRDPHTPIPLSPPYLTWKGEDLDQTAGKMSITGGADEDDGDADDDDLDDYDWNFSQSDMRYLRRRMVHEIYNKRLLDQ